MIHKTLISEECLRKCAITDWWTIGLADLDRMTIALLGPRGNGAWVRRGDHAVVIANQKYGSLASKLDIELSALSAEVKKVLSDNSSASALRAAACYHLRFENIHPLGEGNGRIGRAILAGQIHQHLAIPPEELLTALQAQEMDYLAVFASNSPAIMFELLLDLLAQLTGQIVPEGANMLPFSVLPLYPDRRLVKNKK